MPALVHLGVL